jgi:hypothetical protein
MLAGQRHPPPALQFANLIDARYSFVQNDLRALPVWAFLALLD